MKLIAREPTQEMVDAAYGSSVEDWINPILYRAEVVDMLISSHDAAPEVKAEPVAWLIKWGNAQTSLRAVYLHNAIGDYKMIDANATVTPLFDHPSTRIAELEAENKSLLSQLAKARSDCAAKDKP